MLQMTLAILYVVYLMEADEIIHQFLVEMVLVVQLNNIVLQQEMQLQVIHLQELIQV
jgi:hypothetical protein